MTSTESPPPPSFRTKETNAWPSGHVPTLKVTIASPRPLSFSVNSVTLYDPRSVKEPLSVSPSKVTVEGKSPSTWISRYTPSTVTRTLNFCRSSSARWFLSGLTTGGSCTSVENVFVTVIDPLRISEMYSMPSSRYSRTMQMNCGERMHVKVARYSSLGTHIETP